MSTEQAGLFLLVFLGALGVGFLLCLTIGAWWLLNDWIEPPIRENRRWTLTEWLIKHHVVK